MAQKKVTEYFTNRKRVCSVNPSKKQKLQIENTVSSTEIVQPTSSKRQLDKIKIASKPAEADQIKPATVVKQSTGRKSRKVLKSDVIIKEKGQHINEIYALKKPELGNIVAVPSSACDSHSFSPVPTSTELSPSTLDGRTKKRSRGGKAAPVCVDQFTDSETPSKGFNFELYHDADHEESTSSSARKRLILKCSPRHDSAVQPGKLFTFGGQVSPSSDGSEQQDFANELINAAESEGKKPDGKQLINDSKQEPLKTAAAAAAVGGSLATNKLEKMNKLTTEEFKSKLSKCGGLADLKKKLMEFERNKKEAADVISRKFRITRKALAEESVQVSKESQSKAACSVTHSVSVEPTENQSDAIRKPAYERHQGLTTEVPSTLTLPFSYQVLRELFTSADTTVSMLARRFEVCTIQKLTDAVQTMTKRAFETKHLGQIKTVYPTAYTFRQEKNLRLAGAKTSEYQLTIEANLADNVVNGNGKSNPGHSFTIDKLLSRRSTFYTNLINIVKRFHREFLLKLNIGGTHRDDEILRWHPRFNLDSVPEILSSELPRAPDEQVLRTAKDVLEEAKKSHNELNPILRRALEKVSNCESSTSTASNEVKKVLATDQQTSSVVINTPNKGIPQSLLDKIRAKEAKKLECAMLRRPDQDKRISMLERLPEFMRILRGQFITKKKPALLLRDCCQCLADSSKSYLSPVETDAHLKLIAELVPELVTIVTISTGVYVKLDANASLSLAIDKIQALLKQLLTT